MTADMSYDVRLSSAVRRAEVLLCVCVCVSPRRDARSCEVESRCFRLFEMAARKT